jgi:hypothetical protein
MKHFFYAFFLVIFSIFVTSVVATPVYAQEATVSATPFVTKSSETTLAVTVFLHGIGKAGDSVNKTPSGTDHPLHANRSVTISLYDTQKNLIAMKQGTVVYDPASGSFKGSVLLDTDCKTGKYFVEVNMDQYIKQMLSATQTITTGTTTALPSISLVAGDANNDEYLDIVDYSIVIGCFSELMPAASCDANTKVLGDINDDGVVNQFDYNLFLRELTKAQGK